ncbi:MAG: thiamine phosphate synthase [Nitrospira sp.]|nr:thiamine phosphate synthase [Nitrospira sp.]
MIADSTLLPVGDGGDVVVPLLEAGVVLVKYRCKRERGGDVGGSDDEARRRQAVSLRDVCRRFGVPLIVNDDIGLAAGLEADGVHLGDGDGSVAAARRQLGDGAIIGVSCYVSAARARDDGADYVAFGSVFASPTKPRAARISLDTLRDNTRRCKLPVCAIGGIGPDTARAVWECGVQLIASASGVLAAADPRAAVAACLAARPGQ